MMAGCNLMAIFVSLVAEPLSLESSGEKPSRCSRVPLLFTPPVDPFPVRRSIPELEIVHVCFLQPHLSPLSFTHCGINKAPLLP